MERTAVVLDEHPLWLDAVEAVLARLHVKVEGKTTSVARTLELVEGRLGFGVEAGRLKMTRIADKPAAEPEPEQLAAE